MATQSIVWIDQIPNVYQADVKRLTGISPFFLALMKDIHPEETARLFPSGPDSRTVTLPGKQPDYLPAGPAPDIAGSMQALRQYKRRGLRHFLWWELGRQGSIDASYHALSDWAGSLLEQALIMAIHHLAPRYGRLDQGKFSIIGLGKLGGRELNLGSDVDLMLIWQATGNTLGGRRSISAAEYYAEVSRLLIRLMSERTADGLVWPVDMRLRPGGEGAPICLNLDASLDHYLAYGQTWERAMLIKATVVAGDPSLGHAFIAGIEPFVYRRYLDYSAVAALADMKGRIDAQAGKRPLGPGFDVKKGHGGIREIEFIIQSLQLLHGGQRPRLRVQEGKRALDRLNEAGLIDAAQAQALFKAYRFWRRIEHALQARLGEQTHRLPDDYADYLGAALQTEQIRQDMQQQAEFVAATFQHEVLPLQRHNQSKGYWLSGPRLANLSIKDTDIQASMATALHHIDEHLDKGILPERCRSEIENILDIAMPLWLDDSNGCSACHAFADLIKAIAGRATWIDLLATHRGALNWLIGVLSASRYVARFLVDHPHMLEWPLINARGEAETQQLCRQIDQLDTASDEADTLKTLGRLIDMARIHCALMIDAHRVDAQQIGGWLADIADAAVRFCLRLSLHQLALPTDFPFVALALGKHGSREMGLVSDLDMVFILAPSPDPASTTTRDRDDREYAQRLGRRMIHQLAAKAPFGAGYAFDARLRPSGSSGILVTTLAGFKDYQLSTAQTWEHQALCRARAVAGPAAGRDAVSETLNAIIAIARDPLTLAEDVCAMRARMMAQLSSPSAAIINLKQDAGGLIDIEFLAQYARLAFGSHHTGTLNLLGQLPGNAPTIWQDQATFLRDSYLEYRQMENILRVELWVDIKQLPTDASDSTWQTLKRHSNTGTPDRLRERMAQVHNIFKQLLNSPKTGSQSIPGSQQDTSP